MRALREEKNEKHCQQKYSFKHGLFFASVFFMQHNPNLRSSVFVFAENKACKERMNWACGKQVVFLACILFWYLLVAIRAALPLAASLSFLWYWTTLPVHTVWVFQEWGVSTSNLSFVETNTIFYWTIVLLSLFVFAASLLEGVWILFRPASLAISCFQTSLRIARLVCISCFSCQIEICWAIILAPLALGHVYKHVSRLLFQQPVAPFSISGPFLSA